MKGTSIALLCLLLTTASVFTAEVEATLAEVATFPEQQVTGVSVSGDGRVFVNFPFWADTHKLSVVEVLKDGAQRAFPDEKWNAKDGLPASRFVCVQSVLVHGGKLWILDTGSPKMEGVVAGGAKLVCVNLSNNQVEGIYPFDERSAPAKSYLNDLRIDDKSGSVFITESGVGSLVILNLSTGKARRVLAGHPSTTAEAGVKLLVDGITPIDVKTGASPMFHADGIALDAKNGWLYYHALTGYTMYRIKTEDLVDESLSNEALAKRIENLGETAAPDGMLEDDEGQVYLAAFEDNAIARFNPKTKKSVTIIKDDRLQWPDTMSWGEDGSLYVTTSQIHRQPNYNEGKSLQKGPFALYKVIIKRD